MTNSHLRVRLNHQTAHFTAVLGFNSAIQFNGSPFPARPSSLIKIKIITLLPICKFHEFPKNKWKKEAHQTEKRENYLRIGFGFTVDSSVGTKYRSISRFLVHFNPLPPSRVQELPAIFLANTQQILNIINNQKRRNDPLLRILPSAVHFQQFFFKKRGKKNLLLLKIEQLKKWNIDDKIEQIESEETKYEWFFHFISK